MGVLSSDLSKEDQGISDAAHTIIEKKQENIDIVLNNTWARWNPFTGSDAILFYGNFFNLGYLTFEGVKCAVPATQTIAGVAVATTVCGVIGGALNIAVGAVCLKEGLQALANGDRAKAVRLFLDFAFCSAIGILMITVTLAPTSALGAFFVANPWVLPFLWFVISLPLCVEILNSVQKVWRGTDMASNLKLNELKKLLEQDNIDWNRVETHLKNTVIDFDQIREDFKKKKLESLVERMEILQAEMGPRSAVETTRLFHSLFNHNKEEALKNIEDLQGHVAFWNKAQHVRLFQQVLYFASFGVSMGALGMTSGLAATEATQNFTMAAASGIPLYMDLFWPFARNTPLIVPKVETAELDSEETMLAPSQS